SSDDPQAACPDAMPDPHERLSRPAGLNSAIDYAFYTNILSQRGAAPMTHRTITGDEKTRSDGAGRSVAIGAAAGIAAGLLANLVRKAAVQAPTLAAGRWDEALAAEHAAALTLFDLLEKTP